MYVHFIKEFCSGGLHNGTAAATQTGQKPAPFLFSVFFFFHVC